MLNRLISLIENQTNPRMGGFQCHLQKLEISLKLKTLIIIQAQMGLLLHIQHVLDDLP